MEVIRELAALALVFGLLGAALWLLRGNGKLKWQRAGSARQDAPRLKRLDRLALSPHHALHLVRAGDEVLMLVTHAGGCTLLRPSGPPSPDAEEATCVASRALAFGRRPA